MNVFRIPDRGVLQVGGAEAGSFLQALVTNNVAGIAPGTAVYAALLTPQGKFLHDFFVTPAPDGDALLLEVEAPRIDDLKRRLTMYKLRSRVSIDDVSADWQVLAAPDGGLAGEGAISYTDPRNPDMGQRLLWPAARALPDHTDDLSAYHALRVSHGIPDGSRDIEVEKNFMLEVGFDRLNGIDFRKGCYVGQEITARSKYRGNVRKMLLPCQVTGALPAAGTDVLVDGRSVGTVRSGAGDHVLAMLRLDRPDGELQAGSARLTVTTPKD
ncbi:MAG: hypothetical protein P1U37_02775 [Minwuia sp.]|nr:hypothetical protein [Minwuia sp.]